MHSVANELKSQYTVGAQFIGLCTSQSPMKQVELPELIMSIKEAAG
jgi:hypothetical protein